MRPPRSSAEKCGLQRLAELLGHLLNGVRPLQGWTYGLSAELLCAAAGDNCAGWRCRHDNRLGDFGLHRSTLPPTLGPDAQVLRGQVQFDVRSEPRDDD